MSQKEIVLSGIRATGNLHLGNYFGALSKFVRMQDDYDSMFSSPTCTRSLPLPTPTNFTPM